jgi:hypothetical protein
LIDVGLNELIEIANDIGGGFKFRSEHPRFDRRV